MDHSGAVKVLSRKNAMGKHFGIYHPDCSQNDDTIEVKIISKHNNTLVKLIDEGLRLINDPSLSNSKGEWGRGGGLVRLIPYRSQDSQPLIPEARVEEVEDNRDYLTDVTQ